MITIKEIASQLGVSLGTVDRALHNRGRVSQETIEKVRKIAEENGYVPNQFGSRLRKNQRYKFGVLLPDLGDVHPFWSYIVKGIESARMELETLQIEIAYAFYNSITVGDFLEAGKKLLSEGVDAYIVAPIAEEGMRELVDLFPEIPYAFVDSSLPEFNPRWNFAQNPIAAGKTAARLMSMIQPGLQRVIALPIPNSIFNSTEIRANAFSEEYARIVPSALTIQLPGDTIEEAAESLDKHEDGGDTGIFVVNSQAFLLCDMLEKRGVLNRYRIIGFDLSDENKESLRNGKISAVIGQRPLTQGHDAIITMYNHFVLHHEAEMILSAPIDIYLKENIPSSSHWL